MGSFVNKATGVQFSVDDSKDERYGGEGYESPASKSRSTAKKASTSKSSK